jgi:hypothetical protein
MTRAQASTPDDTVRVLATETGLLVGLHLDRHELSFGGEALAATILSVCADATAAAAERHRAALLRGGVAADVVDRVAPAVAATPHRSERWSMRP